MSSFLTRCAQLTRRDALGLATAATAGCLLPGSRGGTAAAESIGGDRPLLEPVHAMIICPWTPRHPRHEHQLIFPLDDARLLFVWCEYCNDNPPPGAAPGWAGATDEVACRISSMISTDRGRSWGDRKVLQEDQWKHNVKHPNLVRLSAPIAGAMGEFHRQS